MADDTERLFVQLEGRISDFEKKMKQAERRGTKTYGKLQGDSRSATRRMERDMRRASGRINTALASTTAAVGGVSRAWRAFTPLLAAAGFAGFSRGVRTAVSDLSSLGKTARDVSIDVETLQGVQRGFARSANVSQDEVNASLGRFARRIGEAANGQGELNKFVEKYNIDLKDANGELKSQEQLLRDIADVIQRAGSDQERLAIAQGAFGDTGRRLAQTLAGGADEIDRMVRSAEDAGQVIDRDLITRAEELDDRFDDLTRSLETGFKRIAVRAADAFEPMLDAIEEVADRRDDLSDIFGSDAAARGLLGEDMFNQLSGNLSLIAEARRELLNLSQAVGGLEGQGRDTAQAMGDFATQLFRATEVQAARDIAQINEAMQENVRQFREGEISAGEFAERMQALELALDLTVQGIEGVNQSSLDAIKGQFGGLIGLVDLLSARVRDLKAEASNVPADRTPASNRRANIIAGETDEARRNEEARQAAREFIAEQERQRNLTVEQIAIEQEAARIRRDAGEEGVRLTEAQIAAQAKLNVARREDMRGSGGAGQGGGGASGGGDEFTRAAEAIRERTAQLEAEAAALVMAAGAGKEYGTAIDFAMQRARLLNAAQREGLEITPDLEAAVDSLAEAYVASADRAGEAAAQIRDAQIESERGARALSQMFSGILTGSQSASDAMSALLQRIAQVQIEAALTGLFDGSGEGSFAQTIGGLLGFSGGGFTGPGGKNEPKGVVHGGEFVFSKKAVKSIGVGNLESMHQSAKGFASGGFVGNSGTQAGGGNVNIEIVTPPGSDVQEERRPNSSGGDDFTIIIDRAVSSLARDPSSAISRTLGNSFGVGRQTRSR